MRNVKHMFSLHGSLQSKLGCEYVANNLKMRINLKFAKTLPRLRVTITVSLTYYANVKLRKAYFTEVVVILPV